MSFASRLVAWQKRHGRHDLPWQGTRDPYRIWLSEVMLQQTQVAAVIPYYLRFVARFPDVEALAAASLDDVLRLWSGLGYYSRARNLHRAARAVAEHSGGRFPRAFDDVVALPGVGRSTAAAVCVFAYGARHAILDGNVKRVLARAFGIQGYPGEKKVSDRLWRIAEASLPRRDIEAYTQGLMDLGAGVCARRSPACGACPLRRDCVAHRRGATDRYPGRRPAKARPSRGTVMLVLERAGEVLLEKRPPAGVWGGLWSFPEVPPGARIPGICASRYGATVRAAGALPTIEHGFTHFRLSIEPRRLRVTALAPGKRASGCIWLPVADIADAAVPVPVKRIARLL